MGLWHTASGGTYSPVSILGFWAGQARSRAFLIHSRMPGPPLSISIFEYYTKTLNITEKLTCGKGHLQTFHSDINTM